MKLLLLTRHNSRFIRLVRQTRKACVLASLLLTVFLFFGNSAQAQSRQDLFATVIDYINCRLVDLSLKNYTDEPKYHENFNLKLACNLDIDFPTSFEELETFLKEQGIQKTLEMIREVESVKSSFDQPYEKSVITDYIQQKIFSNPDLEQLVSFKVKHDKDFIALKKELDVEIDEFLTVWIVADNSAPNKNTRRNPPGDPGGPDKAAGKPSLGDVLLIVLIVIMGAAILLLFRQYNRAKQYIGEMETKLDQANRENQMLQEKMEEKITGFKKEKTELEEKRLTEVEDLKRKLENKQQSTVNRKMDTPPPAATDEAPPEPVAQKEVFFVSMPNQDGSFNNSSRSEAFKPSASMYEFVINDKNGKVAEFKFVSHPTTLYDALNYPDTYILPVCENITAFDPDAKQIITETPGKARLENNKWIVDQKAKIRFD